MNPPYLLAQAAQPVHTSLRARSNSPRLRMSDPAHCAMSDFLRDPPLTLPEDFSVEEAVNHMFRLGMRAFLVLRELSVVGLMTAAEAARSTARHRRVADVMTPTDDLPAIGWDTLREARVSDLMEIFEATGINHLVVLESHSATVSSVRGLIHRERLERQLSPPWTLRPGMM